MSAHSKAPSDEGVAKHARRRASDHTAEDCVTGALAVPFREPVGPEERLATARHRGRVTLPAAENPPALTTVDVAHLGDVWSYSGSERLHACELARVLEVVGRAVTSSGDTTVGNASAIQPDTATADHNPAANGSAPFHRVERAPSADRVPGASGLSSLASLVGVLSHRVLSHAARQAVTPDGPEVAPVLVQVAQAAAQLDQALADRDPATLSGPARTSAHDRLHDCVVGVARSPLLPDLRRCTPAEVMVGADAPPVSFALDRGPVRLRVAPDLLYLHHDPATCPLRLSGPTWCLVELKTGTIADPGAERRQLSVYALWAEQVHGLPRERGRFLARVVRPRHTTSDTWYWLTDEDVDAVRDLIDADRARFRAAQAWLTAGLVRDVASAFRATSDPRVCRRCTVRGQCPVALERRPSRDVDAADALAEAV